MSGAKKPPPPSHEEFVFRVREPSLSYRFAVQRDRDEPFEERHALHFITECVWPHRFAGRTGNATIYPEQALVDHKLLERDHYLRRSIGYVRTTKSEFETVLRLPPLICWRLGDAMATGLAHSMLTNGIVEKGGMNRVADAPFHGIEFDPVAYVG